MIQHVRTPAEKASTDSLIGFTASFRKLTFSRKPHKPIIWVRMDQTQLSLENYLIFWDRELIN